MWSRLCAKSTLLGYMKTQVKIVILMFSGMLGSAIIIFNGIFAQDPDQMLRLSLIGLSVMFISVVAGLTALKCVYLKQDDAAWLATIKNIATTGELK